MTRSCVRFPDYRSMRATGLRLPLLGTLIFLASACSSWVQLTPAGEQVSLATAAEVTSCRRIGVTNVNALDSIGFVDRGASRLQAELVDLARNEAGEDGGNRIVPESTINEGRQTFGIYRC